MPTRQDRPSNDVLRDEIAQLKTELSEARSDIQGYRNLLIAAAHEMRTPLNAIGLHLEMLARMSSGANDSAQKKHIERAMRVLAGHVRRTSMLLNAARISGGVFVLNTEPVALAELVTSVAELYAAKADFNHARMEVHVEPGIVGQWDREAVETILANLISNALKYGEGASFDITGKADDAGNAIISVADSGPGIPENQSSGIFEKFKRAVPNRKVVGYGLGLWIAEQFARLHGGSIKLEPTITGSTFVVTLPMNRPTTGRSLA
jgi:two-component system, OmpR family, sensor kinase